MSIEEKMEKIRVAAAAGYNLTAKEKLLHKLNLGLSAFPTLSGWKLSIAVSEIHSAINQMSEADAQRVLEILRA